MCEASLHASNSRTARVLARSRTRQNHQTARAYFCKPSNRRILLVGEGNFSFACSLLDIFGSAFVGFAPTADIFGSSWTSCFLPPKISARRG